MDARSYNGGHTTSDHRILVARFKLDRMFGTFSASKKSKLERFAVVRFSGPNNVREAYQQHLKYAPAELSRLIADTFNDVFEKHQPLNIGTGVLIALQKPGKPIGPLKNLRPIVLLTILRKTLSLITLQRISDKVVDFLSPS
ncbi:hypothetical protein NP493_4925g00004 [Ridgeia piscesae]|uniref:Uncharacterized protein n=1 Tax=Ridgeia piscesae TaxID=27915 RepID=A0AAD9IWP9_RIDPI|nr:hypothetical protein NP493_4925g00004 [Ridgeia piscesae]